MCELMINKHKNISAGVLWMMSLSLAEICQYDSVMRRMHGGGGDMWRRVDVR
jgi:hypothetical protein